MKKTNIFILLKQIIMNYQFSFTLVIFDGKRMSIYIYLSYNLFLLGYFML
jgi:hypothetical protein